MADKYRIMSLLSRAGALDIGFRTHGGFETSFRGQILLPAPATAFSRNLGMEYRNQPEPISFSEPTVLRGDIEKIDFTGSEGKFDVVIGELRARISPCSGGKTEEKALRCREAGFISSL